MTKATLKYSKEIPLVSFSKEEFLVLAYEAAKKNNWSISFLSDKGFIAYAKTTLSSWGEEIKLLIESDKAVVTSAYMGNQLFGFGKNKKNVEGFTVSLEEIKPGYSTAELLSKYEELKKEFTVNDEDELNYSRLESKTKSSVFLSLFKPTKGYFFTPIIILTNLLVFILMCISGVNILLPDSESLITWGANFRPLTLEGQWWRLLTCCFIHVGILHLLLNMYALLYIGSLLEPLLGWSKFVIAYLLTGLAASVTSLWWHDLTVSAGASGAIFGLYGVFLAMLTTNLIEKSARRAMLSSILIFVGYNLINGLKGNIDNAAHIGGLVSGLLVGYCYYFIFRDKTQVALRQSIFASLIIIFLLYVAIVCTGLTNDVGIYTENMKEFTAKESQALEVYHLPEGTDKKIVLRKIKQGIRLWYDNLAIIKKTINLDLPEYYQKRNVLLRDYCYARINAFQYGYKAIEENTEKYQSAIERHNNKIAWIIEELK